MSVYYKKTERNDLGSVVENIFSDFNVNPTGTVFLKPNFSGRPPILGGENTSYEVLEAIVKNLVKRNCKIIIGHYALLSLNKSTFPFNQMLSVGGYDKLSKLGDVSFVNLEEQEHRLVKIRGLYIHIPKIIDEVDYFINVPKAKTHMETQVSLSIKNLMGLISGNSRKIFHKFFLNELLGYLGVHIKPNISIIDGLVSMEGDGPHEGTDKETGFIAAGNDLVELDSFIAHLMGFDYKQVVHINQAHKLGVGSFVDKNIIIKYQSELHDFKKPGDHMRFGRKIYFWPTTSCSLCHEVMRDIKKSLKKDIRLGLRFYYHAYFSKKKINIILGRCENMEYFKDDINICIGICTKWFADEHGIDFILGCPPSAEKVVDFMFNKIKE